MEELKKTLAKSKNKKAIPKNPHRIRKVCTRYITMELGKPGETGKRMTHG